jgi:hypothetical protein
MIAKLRAQMRGFLPFRAKFRDRGKTHAKALLDSSAVVKSAVRRPTPGATLKHTTTISVLCALFAFAAQAQQEGFEDSRFEVRVGSQTFTSFTTRLRLDSETLGVGTELELEDDLAVDDKTGVARLDGVVRFGGRHAFAMSYYDITREGTRNISREINYGDTVFPINANVTTEFDQQIVKAAYRFRFMDKERGNLAASAGLHVMTFTTSMRATSGLTTNQKETTAPLPVIGLQGAYKLGGKWNLNGSVEWFDVQAGDLQGTFSDFIVAVEHQTLERFAFGFAMNRLGLRFDAGDADFSGRLDIKFDAGLLYVKGRFGSTDR